MGSVVSFFVDPCENGGGFGSFLCKINPGGTEAGQAAGELFVVWMQLLYFVPFFFDFSSLCCLRSFRQYFRGLVVLAFLFMSFGHQASSFLEANEPDDFFTQGFFIMAVYLACDTGLMAADFDSRFLEGYVSLGLLSLSIMQYFFLLGYGAQTWFYAFLPYIVTSLSLAQRVAKMKRGLMSKDRMHASRTAIMTVYLLLALGLILFALRERSKNPYLYGGMHGICSLSLTLATYILRHPQRGISTSYATWSLKGNDIPAVLRRSKQARVESSMRRDQPTERNRLLHVLNLSEDGDEG